MRNRFLLMIAVVAAAGLLLLSLRQQRIAVIHEMSILHRALDADRARLWHVRSDLSPTALPGGLTAAADGTSTAAPRPPPRLRS